MKKLLSCVALACGLLGLTAGAQAGKSITYTMYAETTAMGPVMIGSKSYSGQIALSFESDTHFAHLAKENGVYVYRNDTGTASITISGGGTTVTAHIKPGQIYVRYDQVNGDLGFGSTVGGIYYPLTISCYQCYGYAGITSALADIAAYPTDESAYPANIMSYATELQGPAYLTGVLTVSSTTPPAINTDLGPMMIGGPNAPGNGKAIFTARIN